MQLGRREDAGDSAGKVKAGASQELLSPGAHVVCSGTKNVCGNASC